MTSDTLRNKRHISVNPLGEGRHVLRWEILRLWQVVNINGRVHTGTQFKGCHGWESALLGVGTGKMMYWGTLVQYYTSLAFCLLWFRSCLLIAGRTISPSQKDNRSILLAQQQKVLQHGVGQRVRYTLGYHLGAWKNEVCFGLPSKE